LLKLLLCPPDFLLPPLKFTALALDLLRVRLPCLRLRKLRTRLFQLLLLLLKLLAAALNLLHVRLGGLRLRNLVALRQNLLLTLKILAEAFELLHVWLRLCNLVLRRQNLPLGPLKLLAGLLRRLYFRSLRDTHRRPGQQKRACG
jgi:hypothetical protein